MSNLWLIFLFVPVLLDLQICGELGTLARCGNVSAIMMNSSSASSSSPPSSLPSGCFIGVVNAWYSLAMQIKVGLPTFLSFSFTSSPHPFIQSFFQEAAARDLKTPDNNDSSLLV